MTPADLYANIEALEKQLHDEIEHEQRESTRRLDALRKLRQKNAQLRASMAMYLQGKTAPTTSTPQPFKVTATLVLDDNGDPA